MQTKKTYLPGTEPQRIKTITTFSIQIPAVAEEMIGK